MKQGWKEKTLDEICVVDWGNTNLTKKSYVISGEFLAVSAAGCDGRVGHKEHPKFTPVLSAIGAQCGKMFFPVEDFTAIKNTITLTPKTSLAHNKFLYYLLTNIELPQRGAGQPFISKGDIRKFKVVVPDYPEQECIVAILDRCFEAIEKAKANVERNLQNAKDLFQANLQLAIEGEMTEEWRKDKSEIKPAELLIKEIKAKREQLIKKKQLRVSSQIKNTKSFIKEYNIPNTWCWVKANEILFVTKLAGFEYTKYISLKPVGDIPVIRAQNVRPMKIDKSNLLFIDSKTSQLLQRCALTKKCLLVTFIGAGIGDVSTFHETERWHLAPNVAKMEAFDGCDELLSIEYLNLFLLSKRGKREIFKHMKATAQPSLSMATIRDFDFPIPPIEEQHFIVKKICKIMDYTKLLSHNYNQELDALDELKKSILQKAFNGELTETEEAA